MNIQRLFWLICLLTCCSGLLKAQAPQLIKSRLPNTQQLMVKGKPFTILGGELGNSTASSIPYLSAKWPVLHSMGLNTVLSPVYWELIEPSEGSFDFATVDSTIAIARRYNMHLVFLWFGTWKNSMSCYVPEWIKTNPQRFERTIDKSGKTIEILSTFDNNILAADCKAYAALMQHIKKVDAAQQTVIMVQVENEVGMLPTAREHTAKANKAFNSAIPVQLSNYLLQYGNSLVPELKALWQQQGSKTKGTWAEVFGNSLATDEIFQAWYYASFVEAVTQAGKKAYNIPMYVNAALNRPNVLPGDYPSAGPLPHVMNLWQAAAPSVDMLSPDFYNPDTKYWCDLYVRNNNTLFVPEMRFDVSCAAKVFYIIGHHHALGFSPFSIENGRQQETEALGKSYDLIRQVQPLLYNSAFVDGFLFDKKELSQTIAVGKYKIKASHDLTLGWHPAAKDSVWQATGGMLIQTDEDEFIVCGSGIVFTFESLDTTFVTNLLRVDEGRFENGKWLPGRRMNGDEDHQGRHVRIPFGEWGVQKVKLYRTNP